MNILLTLFAALMPYYDEPPTGPVYCMGEKQLAYFMELTELEYQSSGGTIVVESADGLVVWVHDNNVAGWCRNIDQGA